MANRRKNSAATAQAIAAEMLRLVSQARQPVHQRERNRARDYYNPLRRLDMARIVRLLEAGERGEYADLQWLYRTVEKRDATLRGLKMRRTSALKKLDWDIKLPDELPDGITPAEAEAQQEYLYSVYNGIENLPQVFEFMALASFRGFSHLEKRWQDNNPALPLARLEPVPQWHWTRHPETWEWVYDPKARGNWSGGTLIEPADFIIRELDDPINEIAIICFLRKNMSQKDWDAFVEDFGIPSVFAILGPNTPSTEVKAWLAQAEKVTGNSRGALPPGSDVKTVAHGSQGETPFKQHKDEQREELVLAGTGGLLTMLTAATGLNSEQAKVHEAAFDAIATAEAAGISADLQTQIDKPGLAREFPGRPQVAYFELAAVDQEDRSALGELLVKLANAGLESDENEVSEKMGLKLRKKAVPAGDGFPPAPAGRPFANRETLANVGREERFLASAAQQFDAAQRAALAPLHDRVAQILAIEDEAEARAAVEKLRADLPALEKQCLSDDATQELEDAFSAIIGTALASGIAEGAGARAETRENAASGAKLAPRHAPTPNDAK
ncbi:Mu-like prophage protein gp29 [Opitutaceae bacterium TAV1]|nr:Mu-like prophage protein gp29 [Opitutaceae bacterium TAV1]